MPDRPAWLPGDLRKLLALQAVHLRMLKIAYNRTRSVAEAKDLVSEASEKLLRGLSPWRPDPARPLDEQIDAFVVHVAFVIRRCFYRRVTSAAARRERELPESMAETVRDSAANVEEMALELEDSRELERRATVWIAGLRSRLAKDEDALAVIAQHERGCHPQAEQAAALGWPLSRLVLARRRIAYHAPLVVAEWLEAVSEAEEQRILAAHAARSERTQP
jgi:DNA-directed RNA polymerase specialized sigma24 family protein